MKHQKADTKWWRSWKKTLFFVYFYEKSNPVTKLTYVKYQTELYSLIFIRNFQMVTHNAPIFGKGSKIELSLKMLGIHDFGILVCSSTYHVHYPFMKLNIVKEQFRSNCYRSSGISFQRWVLLSEIIEVKPPWSLHLPLKSYGQITIVFLLLMQSEPLRRRKSTTSPPFFISNTLKKHN